jgi:hypothetical protein
MSHVPPADHVPYHRVLNHPYPKESLMLALIQRVTKALAGGVSAGLATYIAALPDGVNGAEWAKVLGSAVAAGVIVWAAPKNKPAAAA